MKGKSVGYRPASVAAGVLFWGFFLCSWSFSRLLSSAEENVDVVSDVYGENWPVAARDIEQKEKADVTAEESVDASVGDSRHGHYSPDDVSQENISEEERQDSNSEKRRRSFAASSSSPSSEFSKAFSRTKPSRTSSILSFASTSALSSKTSSSRPSFASISRLVFRIGGLMVLAVATLLFLYRLGNAIVTCLDQVAKDQSTEPHSPAPETTRRRLSSTGEESVPTSDKDTKVTGACAQILLEIPRSGEKTPRVSTTASSLSSSFFRAPTQSARSSSRSSVSAFRVAPAVLLRWEKAVQLFLVLFPAILVSVVGLSALLGQLNNPYSPLLMLPGVFLVFAAFALTYWFSGEYNRRFGGHAEENARFVRGFRQLIAEKAKKLRELQAQEHQRYTRRTSTSARASTSTGTPVPAGTSTSADARRVLFHYTPRYAGDHHKAKESREGSQEENEEDVDRNLADSSRDDADRTNRRRPEVGETIGKSTRF